MVYFYLAFVEFFSTYMTCGSLKGYNLLSDVAPALPVFCSGPEAFVPDDSFSYYFLFLGVGIVPTFQQAPSGFVLIWHYQSRAFCTECVSYPVFLQDFWNAQFVLSTQPVRH